VKGTVPLLWHCSQSTTLRETPTVRVCQCIPKARGIVPLPGKCS